MRRLVASAKPGDGRVWTRKQIFVYSRIRKQTWYKKEFMHQIARTVLKRVKEIYKK